jgi:hypothetical protein
VLELEGSVPVAPVVVGILPEDTDAVVEKDVYETVVSVVSVVEDTGEMVLVLRLEVFDVVELVGPDIPNESKVSSGQTPEVQGSLAQQPRKFPTEQT